MLSEVWTCAKGDTAGMEQEHIDPPADAIAAVSAYVGAVKDGSFPAAEHCF
jgi:ketopantoate hydroxymethyltransferase